MRRLLLPIALLLALLALPGAASASPTQITSFEAPGALLNDFERESTLDEIQRMGVSQIRQLVYWEQFSAQPDSKKAPKVDTADPNLYPVGTWDVLDRLVDSTTRRGIKLQLTLTGPVPKWATAKKKGHLDDPSPRLFGRWARAVVARYGDRVNLWSIWNEPNHPDFLGPQYRHKKPHTPKLYRKLYAAGEQAIHDTAGNERDVVLFGETAPIGNENVVSPLAFLRGALCLNGDYKAKGSCKKLRMDGYAHHAYTRKVGPTFVSEDVDEVSIGSLRRLTSALDKAARAGRIKSGVGHLPDRVRRPELPGQDRRRHAAAPGRVPRDLRADGLREPAREAVLAVPDEGRQAAQGQDRRSTASPASRPGCAPTRASASPPTTASCSRSR